MGKRFISQVSGLILFTARIFMNNNLHVLNHFPTALVYLVFDCFSSIHQKWTAFCLGFCQLAGIKRLTPLSFLQVSTMLHYLIINETFYMYICRPMYVLKYLQKCRTYNIKTNTHVVSELLARINCF